MPPGFFVRTAFCTICLLISVPVIILFAFDAMVTGVLMKRSVRKMVDEFRQHWRNYVFQSLFATLAVFVVLYFLTLQNAVIIASLGATAFIVFAMPSYLPAQP